MEEEINYLKKFVKQHPDNKMGWYLLGKQYAALGKEGKAMYCFAQSEEVYEAFETGPMESMSSDEVKKGLDAMKRVQQMKQMLYLQQQLKVQDRIPGRRFSWYFTSLRLLTLIFLIVFMTTFLPSSSPSPSQVVNSANLQKVKTTLSPIPAASFNPAIVKPTEESSQVFLIHPKFQEVAVKEALLKIVLPDANKSKKAIIAQVQVSADGNWIEWQKQPKPILSTVILADSAILAMQYYDEASCYCQPADSTNANQAVQTWMNQQEQLLVLKTAIDAYAKANQSIPASIDKLVRDYPNNVLPGYTDLMKRAYNTYPQSNTEASKATPAQAGQAGQGLLQKPDRTEKLNPPLVIAQPSLSPQAKNAPINAPQQVPLSGLESSIPEFTIHSPLGEFLEIIIDKVSHQIALVSGNVILRKYPVGLGGDKTPEGSFVISDKVRNPNDRSNGDFGSRGMTLSDTLYAIHGTNQPKSIGKDVSLGCIRMTNEDVEELFNMVPLGTKVTIGKGKLPVDVIKGGSRFQLPLLREETNPGKVYKRLG